MAKSPMAFPSVLWLITHTHVWLILPIRLFKHTPGTFLHSTIKCNSWNKYHGRSCSGNNLLVTASCSERCGSDNASSSWHWGTSGSRRHFNSVFWSFYNFHHKFWCSICTLQMPSRQIPGPYKDSSNCLELQVIVLNTANRFLFSECFITFYPREVSWSWNIPSFQRYFFPLELLQNPPHFWKCKYIHTSKHNTS